MISLISCAFLQPLRALPIFWALSLVCVSAHASTNKQDWLQYDFNHLLQPANYKRLNVNGSETLLRIDPQHLAAAKGVAIIIADGNPFRSPTLNRLPHELNQQGYTVLTLLPATNLAWQLLPIATVPEPAGEAESDTETETTDADEEGNTQEPLANTDAVENDSNETPTSETDGDISPPSPSPFVGPEQLDEQQLADFRKQLEDIMQAVGVEADSYPGMTLVIAAGVSAAELARLYQSNTLPQPDAFVSISAYLPEYQANQEVAGILSQLHVPLLDVYHQFDNRWTLATVEQRKIAARTNIKMFYRQTEILGDIYTHDNSINIARTIYGWTRSLGW